MKENDKRTQEKDTYLTNQEVDRLYDLMGPLGFHGFSCERWTKHYRQQLSKQETNAILDKEYG